MEKGFFQFLLPRVTVSFGYYMFPYRTVFLAQTLPEDYSSRVSTVFCHVISAQQIEIQVRKQNITSSEFH